MKRILVSLLLCGSMIAAASPVFAQAAQQAELRVTVIDQTGASIPMARVLVTAAGATPVAVGVNDRGQVTLTALPIGNVQLHVESDGLHAGRSHGNVTPRQHEPDGHAEHRRSPGGDRRERRGR